MEIKNRKAFFDYDILERYECGIALKGTEVKSIRNGKVDIRDSYAIIRNYELFLLNMYIAPYMQGNIFNHDERRTRKLLMHKKEILKLRDKVNQERLTLVPLRIYLRKNLVKVELALAKGRKTYDKRQVLKEREMKQRMEKELKDFTKTM